MTLPMYGRRWIVRLELPPGREGQQSTAADVRLLAWVGHLSYVVPVA